MSKAKKPNSKMKLSQSWGTAKGLTNPTEQDESHDRLFFLNIICTGYR